MQMKQTISKLKELKCFHNGSYGEAINCAIEMLEDKKSDTYIVQFEKAIQEFKDDLKKMITLNPDKEINKFYLGCIAASLAVICDKLDLLTNEKDK